MHCHCHGSPERDSPVIRREHWTAVASFLALSPSALQAQSECNARQILQPGNCIGDDLDALEAELAKQINDYRLRNG
jgi:hypothetical protein